MTRLYHYICTTITINLNMKDNMRTTTLTLAALLLCSGCYTGRTVSAGDPGATLAGAAIGGNVGSLVGGLIGESNHGPHGAWRGSAIGAIAGTIAGAAIGNAASRAAAEEKEADDAYVIEETVPVQPPRRHRRRAPAADDMLNLRVRNIRFIDDDRDHILSPGEGSKVVFDIVNEGDRPVFGVVPVVEELTGSRHIRISPSLVVERIDPHSGVKYTATVTADRRIRRGEIVLRVAVADERGELYDGQEFSLPTVR